ncbi:hypothetical protein D3C81_1514890 [compost metagenome]
MPNLLPFRPVEMYGWVLASTSGLMRSDTRARLPTRPATSFRRSSSGIDSTLKQRTSCASASSISAALLPTPENTTLRASPPAASTRLSSPPETMSNPAPSLANTCSTARLELAFMAYWTCALRPWQAAA